MKKIFSLALITIFMSLVNSTSVFAQSYGTDNGVPADLTINKEVKNPITNGYVENLGSNDPKYSPNGEITFRLTIRNGSGETMNPVEVVDQLPGYLTFVSATVPSTYDAGLKRVVMTLNNLTAGETRTIELVAKLSDTNTFPSNRSLICENNYSKVTSPARPAGDDDTAQFCVQISVGGAQNLPVAGFNDALTILPFLSMGGVGAFMLLKKKA